MSRQPRLHLPGGFYHVILRGNGRQAIFFDSEDRNQWQTILQKALARYRHRLHAYCWMNNHVHMAVQAGVEPLADFMRVLASRYAKYLNRKRRRPGHLFERRYRAILVQRDEYLIELLRYIHLNPVRASMVSDPSDYQWSSYNAYLRLTGPTWLTVDTVAAMFSSRRSGARESYSRFMVQLPSENTMKMLRQGSPGDERLLGDDNWLQSVLTEFDAIDRHRNLDKIIEDTCQRHNVTEAMLASQSRSRRHSRIRAEIAVTASETRCATVTEVAKRFGRAHSGLSRAMNRLRDQKE